MGAAARGRPWEGATVRGHPWALGQEHGQCRPTPAASTLKGSGQWLCVRHKQLLESRTSETLLSVPVAGQGSVNLLHLIGVLSQLRSVEDTAPNWSRDDKVVRLGRENLNWSVKRQDEQDGRCRRGNRFQRSLSLGRLCAPGR